MTTIPLFRDRSACPLCGSTQPQRVAAVPYEDPRVWGFLERFYGGKARREPLRAVTYEILRCAPCDLLWQRYAPDGALAEEIYEDWVPAEHSLRKKQEAELSLFSGYAREAEQIGRQLGRRPHELEVLDFGMGWGYWCRMAAAFGYRVSGCELSAARVAHAEAQGLRVLRGLEAAGEGRFDFVNAEQVFEHLAEPVQVIAALEATLRPGGVIRIAVPDGSAALRRLRRPGWEAAKDALQPLEHVNCFTTRSLARLGIGVGLEPMSPWARRAAAGPQGRAVWRIARRFSRRARRTRQYFRKMG